LLGLKDVGYGAIELELGYGAIEFGYHAIGPKSVLTIEGMVLFA
jgi:hypothetical protein